MAPASPPFATPSSTTIIQHTALQSHNSNTNTIHQTSKMAQAFPNAFNVDAPTEANKANPYATEAWIEPWLCKHSSFYRNHFTRDGRRESKSVRRGSVVSQEIESRKNSVAAERSASVDSNRSGPSAPEV